VDENNLSTNDQLNGDSQDSSPGLLFGPPEDYLGSRFMPYDLKRSYPVLVEMHEFEGLRPMEMKFVWLYANQMSPYVEASMSDEDRARRSAEDSFWFAENRLKTSISEAEFERFATMNFPPNIKGAIEAMARFDPKLRYEAQVVLDRAIKIAYAAVDFNPEEVRKMPPEERKKVMETIKVSTSALDSLISQKEKNYAFQGLGKKDKNNRDFTGRLDKILSRKREAS